MGDVIHIEEWIERKVNESAQKYRKCKGTCEERESEGELRALGQRLASYKQFAMRKCRSGNG